MTSVIRYTVKCLIWEITKFLISKIKRNALIQPYMHSKEIIIIEEILKKSKPKMCLEWGIGGSTLYFPRFLEENAKWIAIEHNKEWFNKINRLIAEESNVTIYYIPPNHLPWTDEYNDGAFSDLKDYIEFPTKLNEKFDFILIDGRARKHCLVLAFKLLKNNGIVVLHDANRKYYHEPFKLYKYQMLFTDHRSDAGGIWVGSKTMNLYNVLDADKHMLNWKILEDLSKPVQCIRRLLERR